MTVRGIDYAWQHPDPSAIAPDGYVFACRYLSRDLSKNLTLAEAQALAAHGVWCVANWEYGATDALRGRAGGIADATLALAQAKAAGMPAGRPIYASVDWDVMPAQEAAVLDYLAGFASVVGHDGTGEYGGYYPIKTARDAGYAWTWQTSAWSGGQWDPRDTVRQTGSATVGGVQVDVNEAQVADFGQWQPGRLPDITGDDMPLTDDDVTKVATATSALLRNTYLGEQNLDGTQIGAGHTLSLGVMVAQTHARQADLDTKLDGLAASVAKLAAPAVTVDPAAVKAAIQDPATLKALAHAIAVELHNDTPAQ